MVLSDSPRIYLYNIQGQSSFHLDIGVSLNAGKTIGNISEVVNGDTRTIELPIVADSEQTQNWIFTKELILTPQEGETNIQVITTESGAQRAKGRVRYTQSDERI